MTDREQAVIEAAGKMVDAVGLLSHPPYHEDELSLESLIVAGAWESRLIALTLHDASIEAFDAIHAARDELRAALDNAKTEAGQS